MRHRFYRSLLLLGSLAMPLSLLWDFSWESSIGIDLVWSPPHVANYLAVAAAAAGAGGLLDRARLRSQVGLLIVLWGAFCFAVAIAFDRWWQTTYGLAAGIWPPPQILKALAFGAIGLGAWIQAAASASRLPFALAGGSVVALAEVIQLAGEYPNLQHAATFYQANCAVYPGLLVAAALGHPERFSATAVAAVAMATRLLTVWLLPLFPASPQVGPIFNPLSHFIPPTFPLLFVAPALVIDGLTQHEPRGTARGLGFASALERGLAGFVVLLGVQWYFASFLLSARADSWFFAGGGRHWPFFLQIATEAKTTFWPTPGEELTLARGSLAALYAVVSAWGGGWLGRWLQSFRS